MSRATYEIGESGEAEGIMQVIHGQVIDGDAGVPDAFKRGVLAIGNFDGVHRGHQVLLAETRRQAKLIGAAAGAMVFEPHPRLFFRPNEPMFALTTLDEKLRLFSQLKLDFVSVIKFDAAFAGLTPEAFADRILVGSYGARHVVVGYDFYFGKARAGTPDKLRELGAQRGFGVTVIDAVAEAGEVLSSSAVRARLSVGDVHGAAVELGHRWKVSGVVVGGAKRGTGMGFPTANITLSPGTALGHGIYAVFIDIEKARYQGAAYFGPRPTFDNGAPILEVFLFDFDQDLYGRQIDVEFVEFVRPDQKFPDMTTLAAQMDEDCAKARRILAGVGP